MTGDLAPGASKPVLDVCFVTERFPPQPGGVSVAARRLVGYLVDEGFRVHVVHPYHEPGSALEVREVAEYGVTIHRLYYDAWDASSAVALLKLLHSLHKRIRFQLFQGFFLTVAQPCTFVANLPSEHPTPVIASIRGSDALNKILFPYWRDMIMEALEQATWITSVNQYYLDHISPMVAIQGRSSVIYNGVSAVVPEHRWRLHDGNRGVVGTVGQFRMVKDIPLLVRGYAGVPIHARSRLLLAGEFDGDAADEQDWTHTLIQEFGIQDQVRVTGRFPHASVSEHLQAMHVYVQTSAYEGLPNALLEAAAHGVPLIATRVGGMAEILHDGDSALLVPHGDPAALSAAIERVLCDDDLCSRLSHGAMELSSKLSHEQEARQWISLYRQLTNS